MHLHTHTHTHLLLDLLGYFAQVGRSLFSMAVGAGPS